MLAGTRTIKGNYAFLILRPKAHGPSPGGLGLHSLLLFVRLINFFLFPMPVVKNVSGVANASDDVLYVDTHWSRLVGMRPLAPG